MLARFLVAVLVVGSFCGLQAQDTSTVLRLRQHIGYLAGTELQGRYPGTDGNQKAATYIAAKFQSLGLKTVGGSYFQNFSIPTGVSMVGENSTQFEIIVEKIGVPRESIRPVKVSWKAGGDYNPLGFSANGSARGALVFVGFGISDEKKNFDEYKGVDVKGKIAIIISGNPEDYNPHARFKVTNSTRSRVINAREHGAIAVILVHPQGDSSEVMLPLKVDTKSNTSTIPVVHVKRSIVAKLFPKDRTLFGMEQEIVKTHSARSFELPNVTAKLEVNLQTQETTIMNVAGMLPGTDPARSKDYIVIGAHFDHLGMGDEHSLYDGHDAKIHFGADDNASGTAGVIELASNIAAKPLARPVIFIAFNAEERGLLGSIHYTKHPLVGLDSTMCMINMDMIGRLKDNKLNVQGHGTSAAWKAIIDSVNTMYNFAISTTDDGFGPSDHSSFYAKDKPVLFFFTGLHADYHRPSDTPDKINYDGEAKVIGFVEDVVRMIGNGATNPDYVKVKSSAQSGSASSGFKVTFGVIPDYSDHPKGLHITGVREGSPAEKAGLKGDDVIVKFGETTVKNIYDLTFVLGKHEPGDTVKVTVLRGPREDKEVTLDVILEAKK